MKKESFSKHFLNIGSGTVFTMAIGLLTTPIITRLINTVEYGKFSIFQLYANMALMVLCLGLDQALMRFYYDKEEINYKRTLLHKCFFLPLVITVCISIIILLLVFFNIIKFEFSITTIILLSMCVIFQIINRLSLITLRLEFKSKAYSILNIAYKILFVVIILVIYYVFDNKSFSNMAIAMTLSYIIVSIIGICIQKDLWKVQKEKNIYLDTKRLLKYGMPYIIAMGLTTLFQAIDKISINKYCGYSEVGIYSSAMTLVHIFAIIQTTFNAIWTPMAIKHYNSDKENKVFYQNVNQIITVIMFFIGVTIIVFKDILVLLLGEQYRQAIYILPCLIFNPIMYTISETTVCGLVFKEKSSMHMIISLISCVANIIGNIILVPMFGGRGAAISTGISYIIFFTARTLISRHYFCVNYSLTKFYIITFMTLIFALYNTFVKINIFTIIFYIFILILIIVLYKDAFLKIVNKLKQIIKKQLSI